MNSNIKKVGNLFTYRIQVIKLAVKELRSAKFYAILLVSVMLAGIFSLSPAISTLMNDVTIRSTGRIGTPTTTSIVYKSEIRGVFVHCATFGFERDWDIIAQTLANYGINVVYGEFVSTQGSYYPSNYASQVGARDNLAEAITACHARGVEVHVSMDVLFKPKKPLWECENYDGSHNAEGACPSKLIVRAYWENVVKELATNYPDLDGIMFDYIRYVAEGLCYCSECRAKFEAWLGEGTIMDWTPFYPGGSRYNEFMEWRVIPVTELVRDMRNWMLTIRPDLEFSVASWTLLKGGPTYQRYWMGQDTADWVAKNYLDVVAPMIYNTDPAIIQDKLEANMEYLVEGPEGKIPLAPLLTTGITAPVPAENFKAQIDLVRSLGADGWIIWRYGGPGTLLDEYTATPDITQYLSIIDLPDVFSLENMQVSLRETEATITWTTDLPATSEVEYSMSPLFNASFRYNAAAGFHYWDVDHVLGTVIEDPSLVTARNMTLTDLLSGKKYYFRVQSKDTGGIATSKVLTFTTG